MQTFDLVHVPIRGRSLVEASAGTGKTYAIATLFLRLLIECDYSVEQILVVTFTEAATSELKRRIRERLRTALDVCEASSGSSSDAPKHDPLLVQVLTKRGAPSHHTERLKLALQNFDRASIFTIHAFCARVLQDNAFQTGSTFSAELMTDTRELVADAVLDYWAHVITPIHPALAQYLYEKNWKPSQLARFSQWVAQTRPLHVIPAEPNPLPELDTTGFEAAFENAKLAFDAPEVERLVLAANLHKARIPPPKVGQWCDELLAYFKAETANVRPPPNAWKLLPSNLEAARTKASAGHVLAHPFLDALTELRQQFDALDANLRQHFLHLKQQLIHWLQTEVPERKRELGVVSFDDLLYQVHDAILGPGGAGLAQSLRREFPAALIDEFQDTDPTQYTIFDRIYRSTEPEPGSADSAQAADTTLFLIGDPKQAIYSFRGADVFAYLRAAGDVASSRQHTMTTNHRSDPSLIAAVNRIFSVRSQPFYLADISYPLVGARPGVNLALALAGDLDPAPLQFRFIARNGAHGTSLTRSYKHRRLPQLVADEVVVHLTSDCRLDGRALRPRDFAILTRTNEEAFESQRALLDRGVPAVVLGDRSVYEQPDARDLLLILKAVAEPNNIRALRGALVTETLGLDAHELLLLDQEEQAWDRWSDRFRRWHERWFQFGFVQMMHQLLTDCALPERLLTLQDGERRMTNLMQLIELLHTRAVDHHLGPRGVLHYLAEQLSERLVASDSEQVRLESDEDAVVLTTIHKSKGLEYPIVICPTLFNPTLVMSTEKEWPRFHDGAHGHRLTLDLGSAAQEDNVAAMREEALAENLRLLYVALTRAKHRCVVFWGAFFEFQTSALAYLLYGELPLGPADDTESRAKLIAGLDDEALLERLKSLDPSREQIGVSEIDPYAAPSSERQPRHSQTERRLVCCKVERAAQRWERTASFSSLTAGASHEAPRLDPLDGRDHDPAQSLLERPARGDQILTTLAAFPGGTTTGNFFHSVLEHCDFQGDDQSAAVERAMLEHGPPEGLTVPEATELVTLALREILNAKFAGSLTLADIPAHKRLNELEFYLPAPRSRQERALTCAALADAFRRHPSPQVPASYADSLLGLDFAPLTGFLKGFIDLVFEHRGRWYVVDYKTNTVGANYDDYVVQKLSGPMSHSHYILQYHLYCLAVHRYLQLRHPAYDYERDFAGSYYLFLRGMHPLHSPKSGVFFEKPPLARIDALSELFPANAATLNTAAPGTATPSAALTLAGGTP